MDYQATNTVDDDMGQEIDNLLYNPSRRAAILQRPGKFPHPHLTPSGTAGGSSLPTFSGMFPTPCGMFSAPTLTQWRGILSCSR